MKKVAGSIIFVLLMAFGGAYAEESVWDKATSPLDKPLTITVYRSPSCGCCGKWIEHLEKHQFKVTDIKTEEINAVKRKYRVPPQLASCHTALVGGYVIEGHVPAGDIKELLKTKPAVAGLSVPGMPVGTPGMEMGGKKEPFAVMSFDGKGNVKKFNEYRFY